ncbi:hypothetical protein DIPPA_05391 [Diplonema papillatum]|nr:hypothetical protein DIPPA_05391 [Diplonema papillatum]
MPARWTSNEGGTLRRTGPSVPNEVCLFVRNAAYHDPVERFRWQSAYLSGGTPAHDRHVSLLSSSEPPNAATPRQRELGAVRRVPAARVPLPGRELRQNHERVSLVTRDLMNALY